MITKNVYGYGDVTLVPSTISNVCSRKNCHDAYRMAVGMPIFAAPMASVVSDNNLDVFYENRITPIVPRNVQIDKRLSLLKNENWIAVSLSEMKELFCDTLSTVYKDKQCNYKVCLDVANGHMSCLYDTIDKAKQAAEDMGFELTVMTGNIANPETFRYITERNESSYKHNRRLTVDYIRLGIGGGLGCLTTSNVGVHYGQASLIDMCNEIKKEKAWHLCPKIVADGGIRNYSDVIKALALGADYVMIGGLFSQSLESAGLKIITNDSTGRTDWFDITKYENPITYNSRDGKWYEDGNDEPIGVIEVEFFGMASSAGQISLNGAKTKTSEGLSRKLPVKFSLSKWSENMSAYLRSAMSYCDCTYLEDFVGKQTLVINSQAEINSVNK